MTFDYEALGRAVRMLRRKQGLTQEVLSGLAGIARTHLTMIENATIHANVETVWRIALALNMKPSEFFSCVEQELLQPDESDKTK